MSAAIKPSQNLSLSIMLLAGFFILGTSHAFVRDAVCLLCIWCSLGVPYHSWRITHAKHHASTAHMSQDQVFVPKSRSERNLREFDPSRENLEGSSVTQEVMKELWEAVGDSPLAAALGTAGYLIFGWPMYLFTNASGQKRYPSGTNRK